MTADFLVRLCAMSGALCVAIALALMLRRALRAFAGALAAYAVWWLVPAALAWSALPAPVRSVSFDGGLRGSLSATLLVAASGWPMLALCIVWGAGVALAALRLRSQQGRFVRSLGTLSRQEDGTWIAQHGHGCPAVIGLFPPRLVLPRDFGARYSERECALILAHERVHLARGDAYVNAFAALLRCVFWFHPLLPFAAACFRRDQELACDATVLQRFPRARRSYADALLKTQLAQPGLPVGCQWLSSHPLQERIAMLKRPVPNTARRRSGFALILLLSSGGGYAAWAEQPATPAAESRPGANADIRSDAAAKTAVPDAAPPARQSFEKSPNDVDAAAPWDVDVLGNRVESAEQC